MTFASMSLVRALIVLTFTLLQVVGVPMHLACHHHAHADHDHAAAGHAHGSHHADGAHDPHHGHEPFQSDHAADEHHPLATKPKTSTHDPVGDLVPAGAPLILEAPQLAQYAPRADAPTLTTRVFLRPLLARGPPATLRIG